MTTVTMVRTGVANTASVVAAFQRLGCEVEETDDPDLVRETERLVLPGVGAFGPAMEQVRERGLVPPLVERVVEGNPTLAVCLGMQLLGEGSAEDPDVQGLGIVPVRAERFEKERVPQIGWNLVQPQKGCSLLQSGHAYFANSYRWSQVPPGWRGALSHHGGPFVAAVERGAVLACQFHPELSGKWGAALLKRWLDSRNLPC